jgi:hypothetical protein
VRAALFFVLLLWPSFAFAQSSPSPSPMATADLAAQRIAQIFTVQHLSPDWFDDAFLAKTPIAKIEDVVAQLKFGIGTFKSVKKSPERNESDHPAPWMRYLATFREGTDDIYIHIADSGKIDGLQFRTPHSTF